jgi:predicted site-specific integrase-resolvase
MKASEVLEVLRISRITLKRLREKGFIKNADAVGSYNILRKEALPLVDKSILIISIKKQKETIRKSNL